MSHRYWLSCLLCIASPGLLYADPSPLIVRAASQLSSVMVGDCAARVWPGYRFDPIQVLFIDPTPAVHAGWLWDGPLNTLVDFPNDQIPQGAWSPFSFFKLGGNPTDVMSVEQPVSGQGFIPGTEYSFSIAVHEGFHHYVQPSWNLPDPDGARALSYPFQWEPRYLRSQILMSLLQAFSQDPGSAARLSALGAASFWDARMRALHSEETTMNENLDLVEGTARYAEGYAGALAVFGCDQTDSAVLSDLRTHLSEIIDPGMLAKQSILARFNGESYQLGFTSGALLDEKQGATWKPAAAAGVSPLRLVLKDVAPVTQPDDTDQIAAFQANAATTNAQYAQEIDPLIAGYSSASAVRVSIPPAMRTGSMTLSGFVPVSAIPDAIVAVKTTWSGVSSDSVTSITFTKRSLLKFAGATPCGKNQDVAILQLSEFTTTEPGKFTAQAQGVQGSGRFTSAQDPSGLPWVCLY